MLFPTYLIDHGPLFGNEYSVLNSFFIISIKNMTVRFIFATIKKDIHIKKLHHLVKLFIANNQFYLSVSNSAATNDLAENGLKSSIFSPTPIKRIGT